MTADQIAGDARQLCDDIIDLALELRLMLGGDGQAVDTGEPVERWPTIGPPSGA